MIRPFRRHILYLPGFDPMPPRRYRELYRRESALQAGISGYDIQMQPAPRQQGFGWDALATFPSGQARASFQVLVWSDLVQQSMRAGIAGTYLQLLRTCCAYIGSGALWRLMRLRRGPVIAALYPIVVLLLQLLIALAAAALIFSLIGWSLAGLIGGVAAFTGTLIGFRALDHRIFAYYLMHDYAFTARNGGAYPPELEARLTEFSDHLVTALQSGVDEVLVVGHSSGAYLAVSLVADLIRAGRLPATGPALSLLTLGHVVPMASFLPRAMRLRADLAFLSRQDRIFWLDVSAPGDACCFGLCDPVAVTGVAGADQRWPLILSAAFSQTLSPQLLRSLRWRWFRLHFQYLCAFDRPGDYDYFAITAGPVTLAQRFGARAPSPGRIVTPAGPGLP